MPSLFSRSRTTSTPGKKSPFGNSLPGASTVAPYDEFGRVNSRGSGSGVPLVFTSKKDKEKDKKRGQDGKTRARTISSPRPDAGDLGDLVAQIPDGSFLLLNLDRPRDESGEEKTLEHDYGSLSYERHVILGLDEVARLVDVVAVELGTRCLTTPFIFSTLALDISPAAIKRLIRAFLDTCANPTSEEVENRWREEARFAGPHELGMCIRWGLARVVRVVGGQAVRGLISWDHYTEFRDSEAALHYPPAHFATFLPVLPPVLRTILLTLLSLLIRFTAHSASSGHTPPTLSPLFGPLLFGLGPASLSFHHTYIHYLRSVNAMEHLLLAFIRWQDAPKVSGSPSDINANIAFGSATTLGVPTRLKDWIRGYPSMLPSLRVKDKQERPQARRGARTMRVVGVRRNVRMYSPDLVKTAASWASGPRSGQDSSHGLAGSKEWERIAPSALKLQPRYSEGYKKRMDMPANFHPYTGPAGMSSTTSSTSSATSILCDEKDTFALGLGIRENEDRFRTLTELKWGEFETMGFGTPQANEKKLQFDLTESARTSRVSKRTSMNWNDFSTAGFSRTDAPLSATLQFSTPVAHTISSWPTHSADIVKKLKKTQRSLPPFGWDTEPVMGSEEMVEEAFMDVFCDLVYGGGWMDIERGEETDRECNWALIEFKSLPITKTTAIPGSDPRSATIVFLFEEFVPLEYRQQLAKESGSKRRMPFLFSPSSKSKPWKPAATLNGRPYVVGHVPKSPTYREVEFEGLLRSNGSKILTLSKPAPATPSVMLSPVSPADDRPWTPRPGTAGSFQVDPTPNPPTPAKKLERVASDTPLTPSGARKSRFRIPVPSSTTMRRSGLVPAEYSTVDFETRLASYSDDECNETASTKALTPAQKQERRMSRDDAWVDILVASHHRRMASQEAELNVPGVRGLKGGRSDPELASQEVAQVLANVRARSPLSDDEDINARASTVLSVPVATSTKEEIKENDPDIDSVMSYPQRKKLGYFDLHPERRPGGTPLPVRPQANADDSDGDDVPDELVYGIPENVPTPPPKPLRASFETEESEYAPTSPSPIRDIDVPEFADSEDRREEKESGHSRAESTTLPHLMQIVTDASKSASQSKTAALIEMYREREKQGLSSPSPPRLPSQSSSLEAALPPIPVSVPSPVSVPESNTLEIEDEAGIDPEADFLTPPNTVFDESGRNSPGRYVHGAPLHNVIEEEEEE
ncbi:hypothetical protein PAXINDRAFT_172769 [Paxillus involutus ATCC 200175]|uniref:Unplaced genomic scaffold PAXINscaffold_230, whole genome shotgun sequence n=1 Tax=Paxillus involutus ATCC 200175 TaxID=664439 RepID=A0A0C9TLZ7_PAXIN|nr:hypothetical protein PAXINDRAFT_172769 [Paxillus involutus ATCC 200175]